ncbi:putative nucleoredoxin 3 [Diplonema papillatum]|nr:putative nucleoredoxin 3 [Diplonema papillatum]|eukprot:gene6066-9322_t
MTFFEKVFGSQLLTKAGKKATTDVLSGKGHVLCYFSAHWCPPCRRFTPEFAKVYTKTHAAKNYEVVYVSLDRESSAFDEYYGEMPWTAIPYDSSERTSTASKYGGAGIPELVVFTKEGEVVTREGVQNVMEDREFASFPWRPPTFADAMPKTFIKKDGSTVNTDDVLKGKTVGIYCSAHWCPPCRQFTPMLAKFYAAYKAKDPNFEIVFCSSDRDEASMMSYFKADHGDYLCYKFDDPCRTVMQKVISAEGIPTFAVFSPEGKLLNKGGRSKVSEGVEATLKSGWKPPLVGDFKGGIDCQGTDLQATPSIVVFCQGADDDEQDSIMDALQTFSKERESDEKPDVICYIAKTEEGIPSRIRGLCKDNGSAKMKTVGEDALMIMLDVANGTFYESSETDITLENVKKFHADFAAGKLTAKKLVQ